jgi:ubiquinone/menaquinone biosynthesis C-methylase UbiE
VLEIGCGTGNLTLQIAERFPDAHVCGLDPDPRALAIARAKARRRGATVQWDEGSAADLPYPDASMDRVVSSLMFHPLDGADRERALAEVRRVLRPGGQLHLVDFVGHGHGLHAWIGRRDRRIAASTIPDLMTRAGLREVAARRRGNRLGTTSYRAHR